jgi:hypothetical protein
MLAQIRAGQHAAAADALAIEAAKHIVAQTPLNDNDKIVLSLQLDNAVLMDPGQYACIHVCMYACMHVLRLAYSQNITPHTKQTALHASRLPMC